MKVVYLSIGTNLGDRKVNLRRAIKLVERFVEIDTRSPVYDTDPMYFADQPRFYNIIVRGKTKLSPQKLLEATQQVEREMGREGATHNRPRIIDIDILTYGSEIVATDDLALPHPRIAERAFVLIPLKDIAPKFTHPKTKETIADMLKRIPDWHKQVVKTNIRV